MVGMNVLLGKQGILTGLLTRRKKKGQRVAKARVAELKVNAVPLCLAMQATARHQKFEIGDRKIQSNLWSVR